MVSDEMLDDDVYLGRVHQAWALELPTSDTGDNSIRPGVDRNHGNPTQKIWSAMAQIEAHHPAGTPVGWLMATLQIPNSVWKDGHEYVSQAGFVGYPLASPDSLHLVVGLWSWGAGLREHEEDRPICKRATMTTTVSSGSLTHLYSEGGGWTAHRSGDSAAPSTQEDESLHTLGHHGISHRSMTDNFLIHKIHTSLL